MHVIKDDDGSLGPCASLAAKNSDLAHGRGADSLSRGLGQLASHAPVSLPNAPVSGGVVAVLHYAACPMQLARVDQYSKCHPSFSTDKLLRLMPAPPSLMTEEIEILLLVSIRPQKNKIIRSAGKPSLSWIFS